MASIDAVVMRYPPAFDSTSSEEREREERPAVYGCDAWAKPARRYGGAPAFVYSISQKD